MADLNRWVEKAEKSALYLSILNFMLGRMVPFNKPHGFRIVSIRHTAIKVLLPYRKRNLNHIRGLHACALATVSEFATGLVLLLKLDAKKYRLIMQRLEMDYYYQGKMNAYASFSVDEAWMNEKVYRALEQAESVVVPCEVLIHDEKGNHLTTGKVYWQIKDWQRVKTKVA